MPPAPLAFTPGVFVIVDNPYISWATLLLSALTILDVSSQIGEYREAIKRSAKWGDDSFARRQAHKAINVAAMQAVSVSMSVIALSAMAVSHLTRGVDGRMTLVLEGASRLEAAYLVAYISVKIPMWIGVYHSPRRERYVAHVGDGIEALKFHVRYSIGEYFAFVFCLMLPFAGRPISSLLGFALGFLIEALVSFARGSDEERRFRHASVASMGFRLVSSIVFADGCHYIQVVWGSGRNFSERGLCVASFLGALAAILGVHFFLLQRTLRKFYKEKRISSGGRDEKMAINLIHSHLFGSEVLSASRRRALEEEFERSETKGQVEDAVPSTWSLFKTRLCSKSDLVVFSQFDYLFSVVASVASILVVIINIGATRQMNTVRDHFDKVHTALYGRMDEGQVCAFDKVGGIVTTFENEEAARTVGYTVAHCGACGRCSTWQDLRLQYTTRNYLAKESARCAKKSLLFGRDAVHGCLKEEPIGFSDGCAECWTEDILCARSNCALIFLQSNMINTVSNFQVGADTITAATCEEAMCELDFVPCSGANRRRMNITSTIARPGQQLCGIVEVDWEEIFGENGSYDFLGETGNDEL